MCMKTNVLVLIKQTDGRMDRGAHKKKKENFQSKVIKKRIVKINRLVGKVKKHVYVNFYIEIQKFMRSQLENIYKKN